MKDSTREAIAEEVERAITQKDIYISLPIHGMLTAGVIIGATSFVTMTAMQWRAERRKNRKNRKNEK